MVAGKGREAGDTLAVEAYAVVVSVGGAIVRVFPAVAFHDYAPGSGVDAHNLAGHHIGGREGVLEAPFPVVEVVLSAPVALAPPYHLLASQDRLEVEELLAQVGRGAFCNHGSRLTLLRIDAPQGDGVLIARLLQHPSTVTFLLEASQAGKVDDVIGAAGQLQLLHGAGVGIDQVGTEMAHSRVTWHGKLVGLCRGTRM